MEHGVAGPTRSLGGQDQQLLRIGGGMAVAGAVMMMPLQAGAAGADEPGDIASYFAHVLSGPYQVQYLAIGVVSLILGVGLAGISAGLRTGPGRHWATLAIPVLAIGATMAALTGMVAAIALPPVVEAWELAGRDASTFAAASGVWWIVRAGFVAFVFTLLGAGIALLGLALAADGTHRPWLGWLGAVIGVAAMLVALVLAVQGPGVLIEKTVFPVVAMAALLWILVVGVLSWRRAGQTLRRS